MYGCNLYPRVRTEKNAWHNRGVHVWVVTFPRRLRYFLHRDPVLLSRVQHVALRGGEFRVQDFVSWVPPSRPFRASSLSMGVARSPFHWCGRPFGWSSIGDKAR